MVHTVVVCVCAYVCEVTLRPGAERAGSCVSSLSITQSDAMCQTVALGSDRQEGGKYVCLLCPQARSARLLILQ